MTWALYIPDFVPGSPEQFRRRREDIIKAQCFGLPHAPLTVAEENDFWTSLVSEVLAESRNKKNLEWIDRAVFFKVMKRVSEADINFYVALKYFWNRASMQKYADTPDDLRRLMFINEIRIKTARTDCNIGDQCLWIPAVLLNVPIQLVPNLAHFMFELHCEDKLRRITRKIQRNGFRELFAWAFPYAQISQKKKAKKGTSLHDGYVSDTSQKQFVSPEVLSGMIRNMNSKQKRKVREVLKRIQESKAA